jgi:D-alanyl-D-alanine carboxypeptidase
MKRKLLVAGTVVTLVIAGGVLILYWLAGGFAGPITHDEAQREIARLFADAVDEASVHNAVLRVDAPALAVHVNLAGGVAHVADDTPMTIETPFLAASVGKLFTAVTVLTLVDDGTLSLAEPLVAHVDAARVRGLLAADPGPITVRHLLMHRSGMPDYFEGEARDGAPNVLELLRTEPGWRWTVDELLEYTSDHFDAVGAPGDVFHYADTNYDLLGLVIESATGAPYPAVVRERVLVPLDLTRTWYHNDERAPEVDGTSLRYADTFLDDANVAGVPALSLDGAGGGVATTTRDLDRLMRGLLDGEPVALDRLQESWTTGALGPGLDYGLGLWRITPRKVYPLLDDGEILGVSGSTGSFLYWAPEYDAVIAGTFNQTGYQRAHVMFLLRVLSILDRVEPGGSVSGVEEPLVGKSSLSPG